MNYFEILNVSETAEKEVIIAAYKALVKKYHPDSTKYPSEVAKERMNQINEAYSVLKDDARRKQYIESLRVSNQRTGTQYTYNKSYNQSWSKTRADYTERKQDYTQGDNEKTKEPEKSYKDLTLGEKIIGWLFWLGILAVIIGLLIYYN